MLLSCPGFHASATTQACADVVSNQAYQSLQSNLQLGNERAQAQWQMALVILIDL